MTRKILVASSLMLALCFALPAAAQLYGVPNDGPLTPGGPRRGIGPPSLGDNVPDLRLRPARPARIAPAPIYGGGGYGAPRSRAYVDVGTEYEVQRPGAARGIGRRCRTPSRVCLLTDPAPIRAGCSCRLPGGGRAGGNVAR